MNDMAYQQPTVPKHWLDSSIPADWAKYAKEVTKCIIAIRTLQQSPTPIALPLSELDRKLDVALKALERFTDLEELETSTLGQFGECLREIRHAVRDLKEETRNRIQDVRRVVDAAEWTMGEGRNAREHHGGQQNGEMPRNVWEGCTEPERSHAGDKGKGKEKEKEKEKSLPRKVSIHIEG